MTTIEAIFVVVGLYAWCKAILVRSRIRRELVQAIEFHNQAVKEMAAAVEKRREATRIVAHAQAIYHELLPESYEQ